MNLADRAARFLNQGIREVAGPSSHPKIVSWINRCEQLYSTDLPIDDGRYAWCGVFVGSMVLDEIADGGTIPKPPAYFQGAAKWKAWGKSIVLKKAQRGDVVVLTRKGGHHVAICSGITPGGLKVIGGNQGDAVSVAEYDWHRVVSVRRAA